MNEKMTLEDLKAKAKEKYEAGKEWAKKNKELLVVFGPVAVGSLVEIAKIASRHSTVKEQKKLKENYIYDRSAGHYYETKRKLKNKEWLQVDERHTNGESYGEILDDMGLLRK